MMIQDIYNALVADDYIAEKTKYKNEDDEYDYRINFYEYPEVKDVKETHIIIDPISPPYPGDFADDTWLTDDYFFQVDVWSKDMEERNVISSKIRKIMLEQFGFKQLTGGVDEWDKNFDIFRDARRYRGKAYRKDFNNL